MRITHNSIFSPFLRQLNDTQESLEKNNIRLTTGKNLIHLSDKPESIVDIKKANKLVSQNENYQRIINETKQELSAVDDSLRAIGDYLQEIRQLSIDATTAGNSANSDVLGTYIRGILDDIITVANIDFGGKFLFAGTATKAESLDTSLGSSIYPYEIITGTPDSSNPSGLAVVFKGNNNNRIVNRDNNSEEIINVKSDIIFGANGVETLETIIDIYNVLNFTQSGNPRTNAELISKEELAQLNDMQKQLADAYDNINSAASQNGAKLNRLETLDLLLQEENTRLKAFRSLKEDTDYAKTLVGLQRDETSLQYTLQVGARLLQNTLFDFLG